MNYKILIQISLFSCFVLIIYLTLYYYKNDALNPITNQNKLVKIPEDIKVKENEIHKSKPL